MLITFEGIDGSGKSTQIERLSNRIQSRGIETASFREPGGTALSEQIREWLLDSEQQLHPITELMLFSAARSQLMAEQVQPLINDGYVVLLDRFYDSTTAYQGFGRQAAELEEIERLNRMASHHREPDLTIYMKLTWEQALERIGDHEADRMETSGRDFYQRVIEGFDHLAQSSDRVITVDATESKEFVGRKIWQHVKPLLSRK